MMGNKKLSEKDSRALKLAATAVALFLLLQFLVLPAWDDMQAARQEIPLKEQTLAKYRRVIALAGTQEQQADQMGQRLREAETGLLQAPTDALAAAELEKLLKEKAEAQGIQLRSSDFQKSVPGQDGYRQIPIGLQFQSRVEQFVNFLAVLQASDRVLSIPRLNVQPAGGNLKELQVTMTVGGWMKGATEPVR
jgi:Tfp pilus assembly protein PilO